MYFAYYDESGDDGYPKYSSPIFVLTALYVHYLEWKDVYSKIYQFRKKLKEDFNLPIKTEFHTKQFLLDKNPYRDFNFSIEDKILIVDLYCKLVAMLNVRIVNVVINKMKIRTPEYNVLDTAFKYSIQRIENDLNKMSPTKKFIIITDEGRIGKMRKTARQIQKINYIPSKFMASSYRQEIKSLLEDPLPKNSQESVFIQICDLVAYIVYLYSLHHFNIGNLPNRLGKHIDKNKVREWMDVLRESFNLEASNHNQYGLVCYPK